MKRVGVLALQGSFREHMDCLRTMDDIEAFEVRTEEELTRADALILPGGESTAMRRLLERYELLEPLRRRIQSGMPVWGTCAGMILLAGKVAGEEPHIGIMDTTVERNAYGSQLYSFRSEGLWKLNGVAQKAPMVFIRAPRFEAWGAGVEPAAEIDGQVVALRQGSMLATAFHPELVGDTTPYEWLIGQIAN